MTEPFVERRQAPRVRVSGRARLQWTSIMSVGLLDISCRGLLLESSQPLEVGQYGHLSAKLGNDVVIDGDIEIRRVSTLPDGQGYRIGTRFVSLDATTRRTMQQILGIATG